MEAIDPSIFTKLFGDSALVGILFLIVKNLWASKQEGDKALIDYLQSSKRDDLASQQKQIESNDRLTDAIIELKESVQERHAETDRRLTTIEAEVFPASTRRSRTTKQAA